MCISEKNKLLRRQKFIDIEVTLFIGIFFFFFLISEIILNGINETDRGMHECYTTSKNVIIIFFFVASVVQYRQKKNFFPMGGI